MLPCDDHGSMCHHFLHALELVSDWPELVPNTIFLPPGNSWKHCEDHVLGFLQCFKHHPAHTAEGQAGTRWSGPSPRCPGPGLPHKRSTLCDQQGLPVQHGGPQHRGPAGNRPGSLPSHPLHCRLLTQPLPLLPPEVF